MGLSPLMVQYQEIKEKKLKIEFSGDSITSAEGAIGAKNDMDWIPMFFSAHNSYPFCFIFNVKHYINFHFKIIFCSH